jgi:hypothetical protein
MSKQKHASSHSPMRNNMSKQKERKERRKKTTTKMTKEGVRTKTTETSSHN